MVYLVLSSLQFQSRPSFDGCNFEPYNNAVRIANNKSEA